MANRGIDYGLGQTNIDKNTGIRYGVIHQNEVLQAWCDSSVPVYPCNTCENKLDDPDFDDCDFCEPIGHEINDNDYRAGSDSYGDIFIIKSPYYTRAQFCSPCAPGACYLTNPCEDGEKAYCFGHDWFENGKAPYPVYRVLDNKLIEP